jgi:hypothetical protein
LFVNDEIGIVRMDLDHPERFLEFPSDQPPLARWAGNVIDLIEYGIGPQAAGRLLKPSGEPMNYADSIKLIERVFGISVPDLYDRRATALNRTKNTVFQDEMRRVYLDEAKKAYK